MLKLSQPITSINGFKIGDKVRLKDGDGRPHFIKSFSIDGIKEFFFVVQFVDGTEAMFDNISPLPSNLDEAARYYEEHRGPAADSDNEECRKAFKAGAEWMAGQGETGRKTIGKIDDGINQIPTYCNGFEITELDVPFLNSKECGYGDEVIVQIRKKQ